MKKLFILIICLTITGWLQAQYCDSLDNHLAGHYHMDVWDAIELSDGNILVVAWQDSLNTYDNTQEYFPYLKKFYKISRPDLTIIDSFSFEATDRRYKVMARCHRQDSKYNNLVIDVINVDNQSYLNIAFFDDDLNFNDEMEVTTLL